MTRTLNPFGFNRPVTLFQDLVGRRQEIGYILKAQQYSDSNSLVGMPKIGSTSLLRCLFLPETMAAFDFDGQRLHPVYLSLHAMPMASTEELFSRALAKLGVHLPQAGPDETFYIEDAFERLAKDVWPVILIDEFDQVMNNPNMGYSFFKLKLFLEENALATFVTSSHTPYQVIEATIRYREGIDRDSSSRSVDLSGGDYYVLPFTQELVEQYCSRLPRPLRENELLLRHLREWSGGHPYLLKLGCFFAYEQYAAGAGLDMRRLWSAFYQAAQRCFDVLWDTAGDHVIGQLRSGNLPAMGSHFLRRQNEAETTDTKRRDWRYFWQFGGGIMRLNADGNLEFFSSAFRYYAYQRLKREEQEAASAPDPARLRLAIGRHFSLEEIRLLCHDLGVDYDNLRGETKDGKAAELVDFMARANRMPVLLSALRRRRSEVDWDL